MKSFLIVLGIIVAACIFLITSYSTIGRFFITDVLQQEGTLESMKEHADKDPVAFAAKYQPFLDRRNIVGRAAEILDTEFFMELSKDTLDRYLDTPLQTDPAIEHFIAKRAMELDSRVLTQEAWDLYKRYMVLFPTGENVNVVRNAMVHLSLKYGYQ
jgi:hypothetical protein